MRGKWLIILILMGLIFAPVLRAEDNYFHADVSVGYHFDGHDDSLTQVSEYEVHDSSATFETNFTGKIGSFDFAGHGLYYTEDDKEFSLEANAYRVLRTNFDYYSFIHRTRHDTLFADEDKVKGLTAMNPFAWVWSNDAGEYELEGAQKAMHTDLDAGKDYVIKRSEYKFVSKAQLPFFPYLIPEFRIRKELKQGWKQHTFMAGKCASCHVVGTGLRVDWETTDVTFGATFKYGIVTASYFHTESHFDNEARDNYYMFDDVANPNAKKHKVFRSRILYDNAYAKYGEVPDVDKDTDVFKLKLDLPMRATLYGSYVSSRVENNYTDNDYDTDVYYAKLTARIIPRTLTASVYFKYYDIDNEDVKVDLNDYNIVVDPTIDNSVKGPGYGGLPIDYWNYERKSALSRDVTEVGFDFTYLIARGYTLRGSYTYKRVNRDNDEFKDYYNDELKDEEYLDDETTTYHIFKLALSARPFKGLNGRISYEYQRANDPFEYKGAMCFDTWYNIGGPQNPDPSNLPVPTPYYLIFRSWARNADASNVPEDHHKIKISATWTPKNWLSVNAYGSYTYEDNDDADNEWENNSWQAGISFWLMPMEKLYVTFGYDYQRSDYEAWYCIDLFAG